MINTQLTNEISTLGVYLKLPNLELDDNNLIFSCQINHYS
ncbi:protein of unknown function [Moritella yayanosii]|uniref:Uncharacterized protein n=1 Tax=Moritella yayanosii TaxID=69539 RepID=A0A330LJS3_9GAMM|nr:protein of unknown function [Moritella yayanosii]